MSAVAKTDPCQACGRKHRDPNGAQARMCAIKLQMSGITSEDVPALPAFTVTADDLEALAAVYGNGGLLRHADTGETLVWAVPLPKHDVVLTRADVLSYGQEYPAWDDSDGEAQFDWTRAADQINAELRAEAVARQRISVPAALAA